MVIYVSVTTAMMINTNQLLSAGPYDCFLWISKLAVPIIFLIQGTITSTFGHVSLLIVLM